MKNLGYGITTLAVLAGSLVAVVDERLVDWKYFAATVVLGILGIVVIKLSDKREIQQEGKLSANIETLKDSLNSIVAHVRKLNTEKESINPYDMLHRIDEHLPEELARFVDARESISHVFGLQAYAEVMNNFAAGERYLNRVWSASADGYVNEVNAYLEKAEAQFMEANTTLNSFQA